jgi:putative membrane protein
MATAGARGPSAVREHPRATVVVLTAVGYGAVLGTFAGVLPGSVFPDLTLAGVNLLSHVIAAVNTTTTVLLLAGWYWIRRGEVRKHAAAMTASFVLILVFLVLYLAKIGGGGTKEFVGPTLVYYGYLAMLAVHVVLSVVAVPVVLYALVLGITHTPAELRRGTPHRRVGRIAAGSWVLSLSLGVVTYLLLNHVYDFEFVAAAVVP